MDIFMYEQSESEAKEARLAWAKQLFGSSKSDAQLLEEFEDYITRELVRE